MANTANSKQIAFENYEQSSPVQGSSEKAFGWVFTCFFTLVAGFKYWPAFRDWLQGVEGISGLSQDGLIQEGVSFSWPFSWLSMLMSYPWMFAAAITLVLTLLCPRLLKPFNYAWMRFGLILHRIMNPIVMGLLFYGILTPTGWLARCFKWDPLRLHCESNVKTYWIQKEDRPATHLKNQF